MLKNKVDLHVHTNFSDGTFTPAEAVDKAKELGLRAIAITDHDTIDGIEPAIKEAKKQGIEIVPGVELTAYYYSKEIHILGYFIDHKARWFKERLDHFLQVRLERAEKMLEKLRKYDVDLKMEDLLKKKGHGFLGRLQIANLMKEKGYVKSLDEAFKRFIGDYKPCYMPKFSITPKEAVAMIVRAKGIAVFAHPGLTQKDEILPALVQHGLRGIEVFYTEHSPQNTRYYKKLAEKYGLLATGGSDCHGMGKGEVLMGKVETDYEFLEKLKEEKRKIDEKR